MALIDPTQLELLKPKRHKKPGKIITIEGWYSSYGVTRFQIPIKTINPLNVRESVRDRIRRVKREREHAYLQCTAKMQNAIELLNNVNVTIRLVRHAPRSLDDGDNLSASLKAVRDGIAFGLKRNDGPNSGLTWQYDQVKADGYAVGVEIRV